MVNHWEIKRQRWKQGYKTGLARREKQIVKLLENKLHNGEFADGKCSCYECVVIRQCVREIKMPISGCKTLYKVSYWGWDGSSREIDLTTGDVLQMLLTKFVYSFWSDKENILEALDTLGLAVDSDTIDQIEIATDDEVKAFEDGWSARHHDNNDSTGYEE